MQGEWVITEAETVDPLKPRGPLETGIRLTEKNGGRKKWTALSSEKIETVKAQLSSGGAVADIPEGIRVFSPPFPQDFERQGSASWQ